MAGVVVEVAAQAGPRAIGAVLFACAFAAQAALLVLSPTLPAIAGAPSFGVLMLAQVGVGVALALVLSGALAGMTGSTGTRPVLRRGLP